MGKRVFFHWTWIVVPSILFIGVLSYWLSLGPDVRIAQKDLEEIRKQGTLKIGIRYSSWGYFLYQGQALGLEKEAAELLCKSLEIVPEFVVYTEAREALELLMDGSLDLVLWNHELHPVQTRGLAFIRYFPDTALHEDPFMKVQKHYPPDHPNSQIQDTFSRSGLYWVSRSNSVDLNQSVLQWSSWFSQHRSSKSLYNKYLDGGVESRYARKGIQSNRIHPLDPFIKKYAEKLGWDWKLLAALIRVESNFDPYVISGAGAVGLMQILPATAGVDTPELFEPHINLRAGIRYIKYLEGYWADTIPDSAQRIRFVLASYNVGPGHVLDARRLAQEKGLNTLVWDDQVSKGMLLKSDPKHYRSVHARNGYCKGDLVVQFVQDVLEYYGHYSNLVESVPPDNDS